MVEKCMRCMKYPDNNLPMCSTCRMELKKDFQKLADFLNEFDGNKEDALWLIGSEITDRQCVIINSCKVIHDAGGIRLEAPAGKLFTQKKIEEIEKLYRAKNILKNHYKI